jgi:hypothetical protein
MAYAVIDPEKNSACDSMVLFYLFSQKFCTLCKKLVSSALPEAKFPAGKELRNFCNLSRLTRWRWFRPGARPEGRFACGSMVLFLSFSQKTFTE